MTKQNHTQHGLLRRVLFFLKFLEIRLRFILILVITAVVVGYWDHIQNYYERWQREHRPATMLNAADEPTPTTEWEYYCGMHPFVIRDHPGKCPICGMELSKRAKTEAGALPEGTLARVQVSPERIVQGGIQIEPATYRLLTNTIRSYGFVEPPEDRTARIVAHFPGRIEQLMVNTVGQTIGKGEALARIYSPKFLAAAEEYTLAVKGRANAAPSTPETAALDEKRAAALEAAARKRLALAGFTEAQLDAIVKNGKIEDTVTLYAPFAGTVLEKPALEGDTVEEGTVLYTIADLSTIWVQVKIPEAGLAAVKQGMPVEIDTVAWPGEIFYGTADFIYPELDAASRTVTVRVVVANPGEKLKSGMYATATLRSTVGQAIEESGDEAKSKPTPAPPSIPMPTTTQADADTYLASLAEGADYYACSMDPQVVSNKPGDCPLCGMHLEKKQKGAATAAAAEPMDNAQWTEGYACAMHPNELDDKPGICRICNCGMKMKKWRIEKVLAIPESAVIDTGERKVVYLETSPGVYDAKAVTLGNRAEGYYPVIAGLTPGQNIVTQGAFLIDAEARLNPSGK